MLSNRMCLARLSCGRFSSSCQGFVRNGVHYTTSAATCQVVVLVVRAMSTSDSALIPCSALDALRHKAGPDARHARNALRCVPTLTWPCLVVLIECGINI